MVMESLAQRLSCIEVSPQLATQASIIWLHGLGADGHDFEGIVPQLHLPIATRYIFPHAPHRAVTINGGYIMRAWYDIATFDLSRGEDTAGIHESSRLVDDLIAHEIARGIPANRIILAGFSQGGAIALHAGLRYPERLAGIVALSTYLPLAADLTSEASAENRDVPIFMAHATDDTVIPPPHAHISRQKLPEMGYAIEWHEYAMAHGLCDAEVTDIARWISEVLQN